MRYLGCCCYCGDGDDGCARGRVVARTAMARGVKSVGGKKIKKIASLVYCGIPLEVNNYFSVNQLTRLAPKHKFS